MQGSANSSGRRRAQRERRSDAEERRGRQPAAHADGVTGARVGNTHDIGTVELTVNGQPLEANTGLMDLLTGTDSDDNLIQTYCIQLDTQLDHEDLYDEKDWSDLKPPIPSDNLHEVWWVLDNSYPAVGLAQLDAFAGDTGLTSDEAVEATQAAIWSLVDASGHTSLDTSNGGTTATSSTCTTSSSPRRDCTRATRAHPRRRCRSRRRRSATRCPAARSAPSRSTPAT
jgi:TQXA domain-containing protein